MTGLTPKQEAFCLRYIETGNASQAYRLAYDAGSMSPQTVWNEAYRLLKNPDVAVRVAELQMEHAERHNVTVGSLTLELEEAREIARSGNQPSAMVSATLGKAKLHGIASEPPAVVNVTNVLPAQDHAILEQYAGKAD